MSMYLPAHFRDDDPALALQVIADHPFATLVSMHDGAPFVTHCPMIAVQGEQGLELHGHVARANAHHTAWAVQPDALAIFRGPQAYVSPNWYAPASARLAVPTWNYVVVHAQGTLVIEDDEGDKDALLKRLIGHMEPPYAQQWRDMPEDYRHKMLGAIVGFRLTGVRLNGKYKLSQNRAAVDRQGVVEHLQAQGEEAQALAQWMQR
ncbi:MAG: FMN-binding negative transcriptional regulator, partial [Betaproteobacteria bacterium]|nr:FMN-binding negative transcriptional regulator [Betaproteobacteria bacterium]